MTTAARPTFEPAKGGMGRGERDLSALSKQYSARDLPSHTRLKHREHGQASAEEVRARDLRRELEDREKRRPTAASASKKPRLDQIAPSNLDADDPQDEGEGEDEDAASSASDDDDAALYAELERIRRERAEEEGRRDRQRAETEERIRMENIISGNPLLNIAGPPKADMKVRRRWDDDVVFKNCGGGSGSASAQKAFVNDSLRSQFHKRFMEKYIK